MVFDYKDVEMLSQFTSPGGQPIPPESSFGTPYRLSAERMLAKDLRDVGDIRVLEGKTVEIYGKVITLP